MDHLFVFLCVIIVKMRCDTCIFMPQPSLTSSHFYPNLPSTLANEFNKISSNIQNILETNNKSNVGVYFNYVYKDQIIYEMSYGKINRSDINSPKPNRYNIFRIASITKVFTDLMLFQLNERGYIGNINDNINEYISKYNGVEFKPYLTFNTYQNINISFKMLGSHMAGLPHRPPCNQDYDLCNFTTNEIITRLNKYSLIVAPNLFPIYSDLSFDLLGNIMADYFGIKWKDYINEYILKPLNMTQSGNDYTSNVKQQLCIGYIDGYPAPLTNYFWDSPSGQMYSSGNDMFLFLKWIFKQSGWKYNDNGNMDDIILSDQMISEWLKPVYIEHGYKPRIAWGMPWEIVSLNNTNIHTKSGSNPGWESMLYFNYLIKFGGIAYYADGGLTNNPIWDDIINQIYNGIPIMIDYLINNQLTPVYPVYVDQLIGNYSTEFDEVTIQIQWIQLNNDKNDTQFIGLKGGINSAPYKIYWDNSVQNGGNNSNIFYLQTIGGDNCYETGGNQQLILNKQILQNESIIVNGFTTPKYWTLTGPRYWTKI